MSLIDDLEMINLWLAGQFKTQAKLQGKRKSRGRLNPLAAHDLDFYVQHPELFLSHSCELNPSLPIERSLLDPELLEQGSYNPKILLQKQDADRFYTLVSLPLGLLNDADQRLLRNYPRIFNQKLLPKHSSAKMALLQTSAGPIWITDFFTFDIKIKSIADFLVSTFSPPVAQRDASPVRRSRKHPDW
jgi:hypothetical protein